MISEQELNALKNTMASVQKNFSSDGETVILKTLSWTNLWAMDVKFVKEAEMPGVILESDFDLEQNNA